jgi:hypothetical protein
LGFSGSFGPIYCTKSICSSGDLKPSFLCANERSSHQNDKRRNKEKAAAQSGRAGFGLFQRAVLVLAVVVRGAVLVQGREDLQPQDSTILGATL